MIIAASVLFDGAEDPGRSWDERWGSLGEMLVSAWREGLLLSGQDHYRETARKCRRGELPELPWRGGADSAVAKAPAKRIGYHTYLAMWHGLRGEGIEIDTDRTYTLTCTRTKTITRFKPVPQGPTSAAT